MKFVRYSNQHVENQDLCEFEIFCVISPIQEKKNCWHLRFLSFFVSIFKQINYYSNKIKERERRFVICEIYFTVVFRWVEKISDKKKKMSGVLNCRMINVDKRNMILLLLFFIEFPTLLVFHFSLYFSFNFANCPFDLGVRELKMSTEIHHQRNRLQLCGVYAVNAIVNLFFSFLSFFFSF